MIQPHHQAFAYAIEICNILECSVLACLRALPIARVQRSNVPGAMAFARDRCGDAGIHPSAQEHDCLFMHPVDHSSHSNSSAPERESMRPLKTPLVAGSQTNLCSCSP